MSSIAALEAAISQRAREGQAGWLHLPTTISSACSGARAYGFTSSSPMLHEDALNTDNLLVTSTTVAGKDALVVVIAHGNYKDQEAGTLVLLEQDAAMATKDNEESDGHHVEANAKNRAPRRPTFKKYDDASRRFAYPFI